jgi:hypothetical protein
MIVTVFVDIDVILIDDVWCINKLEIWFLKLRIPK